VDAASGGWASGDGGLICLWCEGLEAGHRGGGVSSGNGAGRVAGLVEKRNRPHPR